VNNLRLVVYDQDRSQISRRLMERFTASEYFALVFQATRPLEIDDLLDAGKADAGLIIPPDFSEKVYGERKAGVQMVLSGTNSNTANAARGYAATILDGFSQDVLMDFLRRKEISATLPGVDPMVRVWYNPELEFRYFMVISMIVIAALVVGIFHTAATIVREKDTGTVEQIVITPLRRHELILAKLVPTMTIGLLSLFPRLLIALWFNVPMKGSIPLFFLASAISLFSSMGIGAYVSTLARNLQQALLISFFLIFPIMFLSGTLTPIESMPRALQYFAYLSPITYYMKISLGIFMKGIGLAILWPQFVLFFAFGALIFLLSLFRLRKRIY